MYSICCLPNCKICRLFDINRDVHRKEYKMHFSECYYSRTKLDSKPHTYGQQIRGRNVLGYYIFLCILKFTTLFQLRFADFRVLWEGCRKSKLQAALENLAK